MKFLQPTTADHLQWSRPAFRCGTPADKSKALIAMRRRREYGAAIRESMSQPKTAEEYIGI